jgi:hypothetical protein
MESAKWHGKKRIAEMKAKNRDLLLSCEIENRTRNRRPSLFQIRTTLGRERLPQDRGRRAELGRCFS